MTSGPVRQRALLVAGAAALLLATSAGRATVLVNDTWLDGTDADPASPVYSENGVDADTDGNLESAWFQGGDGTLDPVTTGGPERGRFSAPTIASSASWTTFFTPDATPVALNKGDKVRLTWKFIPTNVNTSNGSNNLRVAVVDTPGASRISANAAPNSATYTGYALFMNMGQTLGVSNPVQLKERFVTTSSDLLSTSGNWGANGVASANLATAGTNGATGFVAGTEYTLIMDFTRTQADELQIDTSMSGGSLNNTGTESISYLDTTPNSGSFTFDTFAVRPSGATTTAEIVDTTLFKVETFVPEPSSLALLALGGLASLRRRRKA
jgi:hypothetical protein